MHTHGGVGTPAGRTSVGT